MPLSRDDFEKIEQKIGDNSVYSEDAVAWIEPKDVFPIIEAFVIDKPSLTVEQVKSMIKERLLNVKACEASRDDVQASDQLEQLLKEIEEAERDGK